METQHHQKNNTPADPAMINRRHFFGLLGSGLVVTFGTAHGITYSLEHEKGLHKDKDSDVSAWIHIGAQGLVTVYTGKAEVGQNIRTALAQIVAEELSIPMDRIEMIMGDTALTPHDRGTFGSRSIPFMGPQLRQASASAREYLVDLAAQRWKVRRQDLRVEHGLVIHNEDQRTVAIEKLTEGKKLLIPVNPDVKVKPVAQWKVAGTSVPKVNGESFVTGKHRYVSDMQLPGMVYGKVLRAPAYGASLISVDTSAAGNLPEVSVVNEGDFVAVTAPTTRAATQALALLKPVWKTSPQPSHGEIFTYLKAKAGRAEGQGMTGDVASAWEAADVKLEHSFTVDYIAHAPLEPRAGLARWEGDHLTVWTGTQRPFGVQEDLMKRFRLPEEKIRVIMPDTGSGYGGKHTGEAGIEAARIARVVGKPVKVVWTREEEFIWAYFRPAGVITVKGGALPDGSISVWDFHNYNSGSSGIETPYVAQNKQIQYHPVDSPLRQGSYRGLAATANVFARESIIDDLADATHMDPLQFRILNLKEPRMVAVLEAAATRFGWSVVQPPVANHGVGMGCGDEKGSYVATCAEVAVDPDTGDVKVTRVVVAFECGAIINPRHLENQVVGSVIQGMGGALFEWIDFQDGKIVNPRFSSYRVPRFGDLPSIEAVLVNRPDLPSVGAGETPILGIAPAIRNALKRATGKKLYRLPLVPNGLRL